MVWESRKGRGRYYTRSKRVGGRVVREYIGTGPMAELAELVDVENRRAREQARAKSERIEAEDAAIDEQLEGLQTRIACLVDGLLVVAGYRKDKRGEWRCTRGQ